MKRTLLASALSLSMLGSAMAPTSIFADSAPQVSVSQESSTLTSKVFENIDVMGEYIIVGDDNLYYINPESKSVISDEVYEVYQRGVDVINDNLKTGAFKIENGSVVPVNYTPPQSPEFSTMAFGNFYPWGYALTLTDQESKDLAYAFTNGGSAGAALTAVLGLIPAPPAKLAQAISYILNLWYVSIGNSISYNNVGYGVTINFHYALYYNITSNKG
ncbi:hypothetical protein [Paenibacillus faecalis]|uniref:hypothetical protein n=1 Tax=Paenibacillus faecalis TaxID=2079532 RepID=UPI000D0E4F6A|nr:hypothetical protein [Paenibacillus faecalis]